MSLKAGQGKLGWLRGVLALGLVVGLALFGATSCKKLAQLTHRPVPSPFTQPRVDAAFQTMAEHIQEDPKFLEALKKGPAADKDGKLNLALPGSGASDLGAQLAAKGTARLAPNEFLELIKLKLKLADASPKLCAGFWSGGLSTPDLGVGLDALADNEINRWFALSERALHLELYATTPLPRFPGKGLVEGIRQIAGALPAGEGDALTAIMRQGVAAPPADGCKAYLQLTRGALTLPDAQRDAFLRAMMFDTLVDW